MSVKTILRALLRWGRRNSRKLLAGSAIAAEALSLWLMNKEAPIAKKRLDQLDPDASLWTKIKMAGPVYIPAFVMFLISSGCIVGGYAIGEANIVAMASLVAAKEADLKKYQQKVIDTLGEEKAQEIHAEIAKDLAKEKPPKDADIVYTTHGGELFFDRLSGRFFTASEEFINNAASRINNKITCEMWASVNAWYRELDLPEVKLGGYVGWNSDHRLKISFYGDRTPEGRYYGVIVYFEDPRLYNNQLPEPID